MPLNVVFFAKVHDPRVLERNEFYNTDIRILRDLGHRVTIATDPKWIPSGDLYFVWWWTWAYFPLLRARLQRAPVIIIGVFDHIMQDGTLESFPSRPRWHQWMIRQSLQLANANVFSSQIEFDHLVREFTIQNPSYSYHTVDTTFYKPLPDSKDRFFLCVCWMNAKNSIRKCVPETIRAVAHLHDQYPDYKLMICGEQLDGYPPLAQLVVDLGAQDYIEFLGPVSREQKIELMQRCSVYLQPTRVEGFGLAIAEAMACGAPVVSTPVGSIPEVVGDIGEMADGANPLDIAGAAHRILSNPERAHWLSVEGAKRISEMFTYERRRSDLEKIIQQCTR